jgi:hypothetical protein
MHARYQQVAVLANVLLALEAMRVCYWPPYLEGVEDRAHLVAGNFYLLLQEPPIDYGAVQRVPRALPLRTEGLAYFVGQLSSVVCSSHRTKITCESLEPNPTSEGEA